MEGGSCYTPAIEGMEMVGKVTALFTKPGSGQPMKQSESLQLIAGKGIDGDDSYGRKHRQVLFVDKAILDQFDLSPGDLRENITVTGIDLKAVSARSRISIGKTELLVQGECTPCSKMDEIRPGLQDALREQRGILASVTTNGRIHVGDPVVISPP